MQKKFTCKLVDFETVYQLSYQLADMIRNSGYSPDLIVTIARGGYVPARLLCDFLHLHDLTSVQVEHYAAGAKKKEEARLEMVLACTGESK